MISRKVFFPWFLGLTRCLTSVLQVFPKSLFLVWLAGLISAPYKVARHLITHRKKKILFGNSCRKFMKNSSKNVQRLEKSIATTFSVQTHRNQNLIVKKPWTATLKSPQNPQTEVVVKNRFWWWTLTHAVNVNYLFEPLFLVNDGWKLA